MKYWINIVSKDHVMIGAKGGFTQASHGAAHNLKKFGKGDMIIFYSPKTSMNNGKPLQNFTAAGIVEDTEPYQAEMRPDFSSVAKEDEIF